MGGKIGGMYMYIEVTLVFLLGMIWWSIPVMPAPSLAPSSAEENLGECWTKVESCLEKNMNESNSNPEFNVSSSSFNRSEFLCCPLMQSTKENDKECFCSITPLLHQDPSGPNITFLLTLCQVADSLASIDSFCSTDSLTSPPRSSTPSSTTPGANALTPHQAPPSPPPPPPPPPPTAPSSGRKNVIIIGSGVAAAILLVLSGVGIGLYCRKRTKKPQSEIEDAPPDHLPHTPSRAEPTGGPPYTITPGSLQYEFKALKAATNNFSEDNKIGQGGFGVVYKGTLPNGRDIAVKRLSNNAGQGDKEFKNEAALVAKLQHRNLVRLVGFCLTKEERLLVYEFAQNRSLDCILFDPEKQRQLDWPKRYNIIKGIARGILYLHEDSPIRIIHRDLKAANILLDAEMNAKISDFGLASIFQVEQTHADASRIVGTCGYMSPEYLIRGQVSAKSDVYSFGVLVLEIVSGKRISALIYQPGGGDNLLSYAWKCLRDGKVLEFMDPTLEDSYSKKEITRCIHLGLQCVQEDMRKRPTMEQIVLMFNSDVSATALSMPQYPAFVFGGSTDQSTTSASAPWSSSEPSDSIVKPTAR